MCSDGKGRDVVEDVVVTGGDAEEWGKVCVGGSEGEGKCGIGIG